MKLRLLGYWKSPSTPHYPHPIQLVQKNWPSTEQKKVVDYLKKAPFMPYAAGGHSYCRFACGKEQNGNREQSDGLYVWPEGFVHYVEQHQVKPPQEFVEHCLQFPLPPRLLLEDQYSMDENWWLTQVANTAIPTTFVDPFQEQYPAYFLLALAPSINKKAAYPFLQQLAQYLNKTTLALYQELSKAGTKITSQQLATLNTWKDFENYITVKKIIP